MYVQFRTNIQVIDLNFVIIIRWEITLSKNNLRNNISTWMYVQFRTNIQVVEKNNHRS